MNHLTNELYHHHYKKAILKIHPKYRVEMEQNYKSAISPKTAFTT